MKSKVLPVLDPKAVQVARGSSEHQGLKVSYLKEIKEKLFKLVTQVELPYPRVTENNNHCLRPQLI